MIRYRNNELADSESLIRRALTLERSAAGSYCLGTVLFALGHITDAEHNAREAIQIDPTMGDPYFLLARIHEAKQDPSATMDDLRTFFRLSPNTAMKPEALAILYRAQQAQSTSSRTSASLH
jgi:tetratricopeptide (TPR) repeat protein